MNSGQKNKGDIVYISYSPEFSRQLKRLAKKYKSIVDDLEALRDELEINPYLGVDLGRGVRKLRMSIRSKGMGKRSGARIITYLISVTGENISIALLTIYDKSEKVSISNKEISALIQSLDKVL